MIFKISVLGGILGILFGILRLGIRYFKNKSIYHNPPKVLIMERILYNKLLGKNEHIAVPAYIHQVILGTCKLFEEEGICKISSLPYMMVFSPESIKFFAREPSAAAKASEYGIVKRFSGDGLVGSDGDKWKKHRKMLLPAFHIGVLQQEFPVYNKKAEELVKKIKKLCNQSWIDLLHPYKIYAFNIITENLFLHQETGERERASEELLELMEKLIQIIALLWLEPWMYYDCFMKMLPAGRRNLLAKERIERLLEKNIRQMKSRKLSKKADEFSEDNRNELYNLLMDYGENAEFSDRDILDHIITFIAAGFETVALSLLWTTYLLGLHSDVQSKVYEEVKDFDKFITYEDTRNMRYTESVIKEAVRLYTPIPLTARQLTEEVVFKNYKIPKGTRIIMALCGLHRNSAVYQNPEHFNPERFLQNPELPYTFQVFGVGARNCIGKQKGLFEVKVRIAHIVKNFRIQSLDQREKIILNFGVSVLPKDPLRIKLTPRQMRTD